MQDQPENNFQPEAASLTPAVSKQDLRYILGILLLTIVVYHPMFFGIPVMPDTWERFEPWNTELGLDGPADPEIRDSNNDAILLYIPWNKFAHDELRAGRIPAWDPYCLGGVPLLQNHLVPVYYPVYALIAWLFSPLFIMGISGLIHTALLGMFFYLFLKEWLGNRFASWITASFLVITLLPAPHYQPWPITLAFFPAIWFHYERWLKHRSPWSGLWMSLCWAVPLLAGYPSLFFQLSLFTALWFFVRPGILEIENRPGWKEIIKILVWPFALGLGISMVQNLPTILASSESDRVIFKSSEELAKEFGWAIPAGEPWQEHVKRLLQPMLPFSFKANDFLNRGNVGIFPVIFALFGLIGWKRDDYPKYVAKIALFVAPFALIPVLNYAVYWLTRGILIDPNPPVEVLGFLIMMLMAVGVAEWHEIARLVKPVEIKFTSALVPTAVGILIAVLASIFIRRASFVPTGDPTVLTIGAALVIASAFLIDNRTRFRYASGAIIFFALLSAGTSGFVTCDYFSQHARNPMPENKLVESLNSLMDLEQDGNWGRVIRYTDGPVDVLSLDEQPYMFYPNLGTYFGIPDAFGYHNLVPKSRFELLREIQDEMVIERRGIVELTPPVDLMDERLFNLGVRYVITETEIESLTPTVEGEGFRIYDLYDQVKRYTPSLRASIIPSEDSGDSGNRIDIRRLDLPVIHIDEPGLFVVETNYEFDGLLVFNEGYASGWEVEVDGDDREIVVHERFSMGVNIDSDSHMVKFQYYMPGWKEGMSITILGLLAWILIGTFIAPSKKGK